MIRELHGHHVVETALLPVDGSLGEHTVGVREGRGVRLEAKGVEGGDRQRVLRCAHGQPPDVGEIADGMGRVRGQLPIADVHDGEDARPALLDRPRVVLAPHQIDQLAEFLQRAEQVRHVQPAAGRRERHEVIRRQHGHLDIAVLERADGLLFVPKPHVGIQLKFEGAARIFLGQFDQLPVGHVDVVLFARADRGSHLDRNGGHGPPRYKAGQRRADKKDHRASFHNILSPRVVPSSRTEGPFFQDPGTPAVPGCPFQS